MTARGGAVRNNWAVTASGPQALSGRVSKSPGQLADGERLQLLNLVPGKALENIPFWWLVVLVDLPELSPIFEPLGHSFIWRQSAVWSLPSQLTAAKAPEKPFEAFGVSLCQPCFVLEVTLIICSLLC